MIKGMRTLDPTKLGRGYSVASEVPAGLKLPDSIAAPGNQSNAEESLAFALQVTDVQAPVREHRFHPTRKWRFDFAWPALKLAVEIEGITYEHGRHQRKDGFEQDLEKYESALLLGWTVYRCSNRTVTSGRALQVIEQLLEQLERNTNENTGIPHD